MKLYKLFFLFAILFSFASCESERNFVEFDDLEKGIYARRLAGPIGSYNGAFNFLDLEGSDVSFTVEFYDENNGQGVREYNWTVAYSGRPDLGFRPLFSITSFTNNAKGRPQTDFTLSFQGALNALGLAYEDVQGGAFFTFNGEIIDEEGNSFKASNTGGNVISSAPFSALFTYRANLICPTSLNGVYEASTVGWCGNPWEGTIEFVNTTGTNYDILAYDAAHPRDPANPDFSMGAYWACYGGTATLPGGSLKMVDACLRLSFSGASRWGEVYSFNEITPNGSNLIIDWVNDYGEGGVTTLTRTDGTNWPPLKK